jgi:hypothetical protein
LLPAAGKKKNAGCPYLLVQRMQAGLGERLSVSLVVVNEVALQAKEKGVKRLSTETEKEKNIRDLPSHPRDCPQAKRRAPKNLKMRMERQY